VGPAGFTCPRADVDFRVGGSTLVTLPGGRTQVTVTEFGYTKEEARAQSQLGQEQCRDKMQAVFAGGR